MVAGPLASCRGEPELTPDFFNRSDRGGRFQEANSSCWLFRLSPQKGEFVRPFLLLAPCSPHEDL